MASLNYNMSPRSEFNSNWDWLWHLQNDLGNNDLTIACSKRAVDGTCLFSKWYNFFELQHIDRKAMIRYYNNFKVLLARDEFINLASHRSLLKNEVILDVDEKKNFTSIEEHARAICKGLIELGISFRVYSTGSKGYHIHCYSYRDIGNRTAILSFFGCDVQKTGKALIAIEGQPHWKSGKVKSEVLF